MITSLRQLFLERVAQTSDEPLCFEIDRAEGALLYDTHGRAFIDAIGGISVANIGHSNEHVVASCERQLRKYLHTMVYGEMVQAPQVQYAQALVQILPPSLNTVFFTNSGAEATEGAMKLVKRFTKRSKFIACNNSYHGSSQGALSMIGSEYWRAAYRPLLPDVWHYDYNSQELVDAIDSSTAAVFIELIQAESGVLPAQQAWVDAIRSACTIHGALLVIDEAQSGFGRTGSMWAIDGYSVVPDILLLAKAVGGGLPLGAFVADASVMQVLRVQPVLGHISTFGGHPLSCTAGLAALQVLQKENLAALAEQKGAYLEAKMKSIGIECFRRSGLWMAIFFKDYDTNKKVIDICLAQGVFTDWFLFASNALRLSPPLCISTAELDQLVRVIDEAVKTFSQLQNQPTV
jgi:acetylornithine/N-succinyldiaminopimelate aminotransferase